ncbi:MAG TPA: S41 family peptidase [Chitinophagales bacterium]|nr:S41 family peptidase [Chitinophagales bacterium]
MNRKFNIWLPILMTFLLVAGIQIGLVLNGARKAPIFSKSNIGILDQVLDYVQAKYVDTVNLGSLEDGAIEKVLENLDPHSTFIPSSDLAEVNQELEGNFEGIGIEFFIVADTVMVVNVISGGPAESVGILSGDKIITINDTLFAGKDIDDRDVVGQLRGKKGSKVNIGIRRKGSGSLLSFTITRDRIPMYSIDATYMIDAQTGFVKINRFSETTYDEFMNSLKELKEQGMTRLVIDLRQNGGGYLNAATDITDELLDQPKLMVYTKGRVYSRTDYKTRVLGQFEEGALAILIDEGSASASEIVTGAIQDWDRGVVVGRRSFGKGLVQEQYGLNDGSALRLTVAKYYTPSGRCIQKPYNHDLDAYYNDLADRYRNGEFTSKDSIHQLDTVKYYTSKGRLVYGGGGIMPDVFVPLDTSNNDNKFLNAVLGQGLIQQFSYSYYHEYSGLLDSYKNAAAFRKNFQVTNDIFNAFVNYASKNNIQAKEGELNHAKSFISLRIKAFLAREKFSQDAFYAVLNDEDETVLKALQSMNKEVTAYAPYK